MMTEAIGIIQIQEEFGVHGTSARARRDLAASKSDC